MLASDMAKLGFQIEECSIVQLSCKDGVEEERGCQRKMNRTPMMLAKPCHKPTLRQVVVYAKPTYQEPHTNVVRIGWPVEVPDVKPQSRTKHILQLLVILEH